MEMDKIEEILDFLILFSWAGIGLVVFIALLINLIYKAITFDIKTKEVKNRTDKIVSKIKNGIIEVLSPEGFIDSDGSRCKRNIKNIIISVDYVDSLDSNKLFRQDIIKEEVKIDTNIIPLAMMARATHMIIEEINLKKAEEEDANN